ncbi:phosphopantetheine-binding protein [Aeromonas salmonicida]|uniref:phosphopantetheine-binding protein n=1 Tax=Aeromonas salmonicida TaxID=645 RepID=UPI00240DEC06|nr:phosphopantetheine-binding protein [Aeromonas salmonicida]WFC14190.1 phosphopantetheine-binding protein [Aeromonas salmonicida]
MTNLEMISHQWLQERVQQLIEDNDTELDQEESLILYGLDSLRVMQFAAELKERNIHVSFEDLIKSPTLASWRELIANRQAIAR